MQIRRSIGIALIGLVLSTGSAMAAYRAERDIKLNITLAPSLLKPTGATGLLSFAVQEGAHQTVTETTGAELDHSYVWINLNDQPLLGIDPLWVSGRQPVVD